MSRRKRRSLDNLMNNDNNTEISASNEPALKRIKLDKDNNSDNDNIESTRSPSLNLDNKCGKIIHGNKDYAFHYLYNNKEDSNLITLTDLKQIFASCLPRMGKKYVMRHVFDYNHRLLACKLKNNNSITNNDDIDGEVIGGMCIRPFFNVNFAEVVFLAVKSEYQRKSIGRLLMRVFKQFLVGNGINKLYTYADNQAIDFFTKMGFKTVHVTKNTYKEAFYPYIKHYTGSELMECKLYNNVNYINFDNTLYTLQLNYLKKITQIRHDNQKIYSCHKNMLTNMDDIAIELSLKQSTVMLLKNNGIINDKELSKANKNGKLKKIIIEDNKLPISIYTKLDKYINTPRESNGIKLIDINQINGVKNKNKLISVNNNITNNNNNNTYKKCWSILDKLFHNNDSIYFKDAVNKNSVPTYYDIIKKPMDLTTMKRKLSSQKYTNFDQFNADFKQIIKNCKIFNKPNSTIVRSADNLDKFYQDLM